MPILIVLKKHTTRGNGGTLKCFDIRLHKNSIVVNSLISLIRLQRECIVYLFILIVDKKKKYRFNLNL